MKKKCYKPKIYKNNQNLEESEENKCKNETNRKGRGKYNKNKDS